MPVSLGRNSDAMGGSCSKNKLKDQLSDRMSAAGSFPDYGLYDYVSNVGGGNSRFDYNQLVGLNLLADKNGGYGAYSGCAEGINQNTALLATAAAIAVGAATLYRSITLQTMGRRRRRSGRGEEQAQSILGYLSDRVWLGE